MADSLGETVSHTVNHLFHCNTSVYNAKTPKTDRLTEKTRIHLKNIFVVRSVIQV